MAVKKIVKGLGALTLAAALSSCIYTKDKRAAKEKRVESQTTVIDKDKCGKELSEVKEQLIYYAGISEAANKYAELPGDKEYIESRVYPNLIRLEERKMELSAICPDAEAYYEFLAEQLKQLRMNDGNIRLVSRYADGNYLVGILLEKPDTAYYMKIAPDLYGFIASVYVDSWNKGVIDRRHYCRFAGYKQELFDRSIEAILNKDDGFIGELNSIALGMLTKIDECPSKSDIKGPEALDYFALNGIDLTKR